MSWQNLFSAARDALLVTYFIFHVGFTAYALCVFRQGWSLQPHVEPYVAPATSPVEQAESVEASEPSSPPSLFDDINFYSSAVRR